MSRAFIDLLTRVLKLPDVDPTPDPGEPTAHYLAALRAADRNDWRALMDAGEPGDREARVNDIVLIALSAAIGESRVLVSARRLRELRAGADDVEIEAIEPIERTARVLQAPE